MCCRTERAVTRCGISAMTGRIGPSPLRRDTLPRLGVDRTAGLIVSTRGCRRGKSVRLFVIGVAVAVAGCTRNEGQPPRADDAIAVKPEPSLITLPVTANLDDLSAMLERRLPQQLWRMDKRDHSCVKRKTVDLGIAKIKTPVIKCRITGSVTHGRITIGGVGETIQATIPVHATMRVEGVAGIHETATADAVAHATIRLTFARDWTPRGTVKLDYRWTDPPHADVLGQRLDLTRQADEKLRPVVARLERELPGELGKLGIRKAIGKAWAAAFTSVSLNRDDPAVWMRITPEALQYGGYEVVDGRLRLHLGMRALTETYVGHHPVAPAARPLPPLEPLAGEAGRVSVFVPVFADYRVLEPVLMKALHKRSRRPFDVPGFSPVTARFDRVSIYGTDHGRIAVGLTFAALEQGKDRPTRGTVWMTGKPVTQPDSRHVGFDDFHVSGTTDMTGGDLILDVTNAPGVATMVAGMLAQNFEKDYVELIGKIDRAISEKRKGALLITADLTRARTGRLQAAGKGLYLPVWATGTIATSLSVDGGR